MNFFVGRRNGDAANDLIYDGGGIGLLVVAESVHGDGGLDLFDGSMGGEILFLESWPEVEGVREVLPYAGFVGED